MSVTVRMDCHTHVWPDKIAAQALAGAFPELPRRGDGRVTSLQGALDDAGIDAAVCLGVANEARHVAAVNRFAGSLPAGLIGFGSVHPTLDPDVIVRDLRSNGLKGVKIHPIVQGFGLDDPALQTILDALQGEFAVIMHVGGGGAEHADHACGPEQLRRVVQDFPRLDVIACHFGGYRMLDAAEDVVVGLPVYLDTSWPPGLATLEPGRIAALVQRHGPDRIIFGSDWPMADIAAEVAAIERLGLPPWQIEAILGGNLQRMLAAEET